MYDHHSFRPDYDPDTDESVIVCLGAVVEGPYCPDWRRPGFVAPISPAKKAQNMTEGILGLFQSLGVFAADEFAASLKSFTEHYWTIPSLAFDEAEWFGSDILPVEECTEDPGVSVDWPMWGITTDSLMPKELLKARLALKELNPAELTAIPLPESKADYTAIVEMHNDGLIPFPGGKKK